jgi:ParB-like chromosome segregation protein Spo0J
MMYRSRWFAFEIPDAWWEAAGLRDFAPHRSEYRAGPSVDFDLETIILPIDNVGVDPRGVGVPDFGRERMISVLEAIRQNLALPPIEVTEAGGEGCTYALYHGRHRMAASIAVGFAFIPAVVVRGLDEIKHAESMD